MKTQWTKWTMLAAVGLTIGCSAAVEGDAKGAEDNPILDGGKADTFFEPTVHGQFDFSDGGANTAELSVDEGFHAWDFELTDRATVLLETTSSEGVDTVMYLLDEASVVDKNDDGGQGLLSAIERELAPGEYRIVVKGFSENTTGLFGVAGVCSGDGCPTLPVEPAVCGQPSTRTFTKNVTDSCMLGIRDALVTDTTREHDEVQFYDWDERCAAITEPTTVVALSAIEKHIAERGGMETVLAELAPSGEETEFFINATEHLGGSAVVTLTVFGAEFSDFKVVVDGDGIPRMVSEYKNDIFGNYESDTYYDCDGGDDISDMADQCTEGLFALENVGQNVSEAGTIRVGDRPELPALAASAVAEFAKWAFLDDDDEVDFVYFGSAYRMEVLVEAGDHSETFDMVDLIEVGAFTVFNDDRATCSYAVEDRVGNHSATDLDATEKLPVGELVATSIYYDQISTHSAHKVGLDIVEAPAGAQMEVAVYSGSEMSDVDRVSTTGLVDVSAGRVEFELESLVPMDKENQYWVIVKAATDGIEVRANSWDQHYNLGDTEFAETLAPAAGEAGSALGTWLVVDWM